MDKGKLGLIAILLRVFRASVDQFSHIYWYLNDMLVSECTNFPYFPNAYILNTSDLLLGIHELRVEARNVNGSDAISWLFKIKSSSAITTVSFGNKQCTNPEDTVLVKISPQLKTRSDGSRFIEIHWNAGNRWPGGESAQSNPILKASVRARVWASWRDCIHEPGGHCTDVEKK